MKDWTATVDWLQDHEPTDDEITEWHRQLAELHAAIGFDRPEPGTVEASATISFEAGTLREATSSALRRVEDATGHRATGVQVLTTAEFDRRQEAPQIPDLVGYAEIADTLGVSRQRARELATTGRSFPSPVTSTSSGPLFLRASVEAWASTWERKPGRPKMSA